MTTAPNKRERANRPPTNDLLRMASFSVRSADPGEPDPDGLTLDGYAAVFNRETIIDSWEGRFKEVVDPGSMRKSFREKPPIVQFDHGTHPTIGSLPIASVRSITEDSDPVLAPEGGAHIVARLFDNWLVEPVRMAIADGAISGMSFRFGVIRDEWRTADGSAVTGDDLYAELERTWFSDVPDDELLTRHLREVRVPELGPVVYPAYAETSVGVRNRTVTIDLGRIRSDPAQRRMLAEAVLLADTVERDEERDAPLSTGHPAEQHPSQTDDSPQVTGRNASADEHETKTTESVSTRPVDLVLRDFRSRLRSITPK